MHHLRRLKLLKDSEFAACDVPFIISEQVLTQLRSLVAFMKTMDLPYRLLGDARGIVPMHRYGHQNGQQSGHILNHCFVFCHPGGRRGDTERVVARWRRLMAFMKAWTSYIGRCATYCTIAPPWLLKWPVKEVRLFVVVASFVDQT